MTTEPGAADGIVTEAAAWAMGCDHCRYGLIDPPPVAGYTASLVVARAIQHRHGYLAVCDCRAGQAYARLLNRVWNQIDDATEYVPATWSTAVHTQLRELDEPPPIRAVHGMEID